MTAKEMQKIHESTFESIRKANQYGQDYWSARTLQTVLGYSKWDKFLSVIEKARQACANSGQETANHFLQTGKMVDIGSGAQREIEDIELSRYACYLIVQNADPAKPIVALGQTYFAVQTRKQELIEESDYQNLKTEDERRLFLRNQLKVHNQQLAGAAKNAGVVEPVDYAIFQDHGYKGLYGGLASRDIHTRKGLKKGQQILDHMGSTELAANLFRATQAEEKLKRDNVKDKLTANRTHFEVGKKVRKTIEEIGGTMPENLPGVQSIKLVERKQLKKLPKK
ncbi:MAG TPA: DNA damage-inducible protein D [Candidatus Omnitrophica bacterium]|nr:DNA damage-inducible protein D [Candidatus Omnitrophota bacterium]HCI44744.1 DNA damage-inducible protein D [Candidatus Omnitrophota bacterium]